MDMIELCMTTDTQAHYGILCCFTVFTNKQWKYVLHDWCVVVTKPHMRWDTRHTIATGISLISKALAYIAAETLQEHRSGASSPRYTSTTKTDFWVRRTPMPRVWAWDEKQREDKYDWANPGVSANGARGRSRQANLEDSEDSEDTEK